MELKHTNSCTNSNGEIILAIILSFLEFFLFENCEIEFKNKSYMLFYQIVSMIAYKTRSSITFTSLIQMEWIKVLNVEKYIIYKEKINLKFLRVLFFG